MLLAWAGASTPTFVTGMAGIVETGNVALVTTGTYSPYGFTSSSTTITYTNAYSAKPLFGYGYQSIQSLFPVTSSATETIFDLTPTISTSSTVLLLNFTANAVSQFSVNYMVAVSTFFMEIKNFHFLLTSQSVFTQLDGTTRTATLSLGYVMKSNSSNAVVAYTTIGLSMMRTNIHTFEYTLTIASTTSTTLSLTLSVMPLNRMRFIRLCLFDYETIPIKYLPPYYLTMGFGVTLSEAIPESSGLGFTNQGTIMTGMSDWIVSDASGSIDYSLGVTSTNPTYLLTSYSISRITVSYVWYYQ